MSRSLPDGQLERTIKSGTSRLICVDFWNKTCPPCVSIKPFWDSLPARYKTCDFYDVVCQECPGTAQNFQIRATPTFIFFLKGKIIDRIEGADKGRITSIIENNKPAGDFSGRAHTIGGASLASQEDFFAKICAKKETDSKPKHECGNCQGGVCKIPQSKAADPDVVEDLESMGFSAQKIQAAIKATNFGSLDDCVQWIAEHGDDVPENEKVQEAKEPEPAPASEEKPAQEPEPEPAKEEEKKAEEPEPELAPLTPAGESMKQELVDMGFDEALVLKAIDYCDAESIDKAIDYISIVQSGGVPPKKKRKLTEEEAKAKVAELRAKAKAAEEARNSPQAIAAREAKRRKEVQEEMERREIMEAQKRERELRAREKEKIEEKLELERVKARIRANRAAQKKEQAPEKIAQPAAAPVAPKAKGPITEATLQLVFPDNSKKVMKFKAEENLYAVEAKVKEQISLGGRSIVFYTTIPRADIPKSNWGKSLLELKLAPRTQLGVRFQ